MSVLARIMMVIFAYIVACIAASIVLTIGTLMPNWQALDQLGAPPAALQSVALWSVVVVGAAVIIALAFVPSLIAIVLAEAFGLRSVIVYGALGGAVALVTAAGLNFGGYFNSLDIDLAREREVFAAAGIAGGLAYWLFAGRRAGAWK